MANDAQMPELMPCPFCGSGPTVSIQNASFSGVEALYWHGLHFVNCGTCGAEGSREEDRFAAITAWNRRDLCASGQQVRALEWDDFDGQGAKATAMLIASYLIARWSDGRFEISVSAPGYSIGFDGERFHPTLEAAKAAAQADYELRILAALTPAPQPEGATPTAQEAVPVAWLWLARDGRVRSASNDPPTKDHIDGASADGDEIIPVYAHPPQPSETVAEPRVICLPYPMHGYGVCVGGRYDGWLMWQHPDGQWVTKANLESVDPRALKGDGE